MEGKWVQHPLDSGTVVFVHGILSDGESCWRSPSGAYWPSLVASEFPKLGVYVFTYESNIFSGNYDVGDAVTALKAFLSLERISDSSSIVFVCHSMGGIVARRYLVKYQDNIKTRHPKIGLFLVASPSLGAEYANWISGIAKIFGHTQAQALKFAEDNTFLNDLDEDFVMLKEANSFPMFGKELMEHQFLFAKGWWRKPVVASFSAGKNFGEPFKVPKSDHCSIAKPDSANSIQHRLLAQFLEDKFNFERKPKVNDEIEPPPKQPVSEIKSDKLKLFISISETKSDKLKLFVSIIAIIVILYFSYSHLIKSNFHKKATAAVENPVVPPFKDQPPSKVENGLTESKQNESYKNKDRDKKTKKNLKSALNSGANKAKEVGQTDKSNVDNGEEKQVEPVFNNKPLSTDNPDKTVTKTKEIAEKSGDQVGASQTEAESVSKSVKDQPETPSKSPTESSAQEIETKLDPSLIIDPHPVVTEPNTNGIAENPKVDQIEAKQPESASNNNPQSVDKPVVKVTTPEQSNESPVEQSSQQSETQQP